ncbi:MAG: thiol reductant ABC exporter subunit CydD [Spiribacter sp.]|nr:thiol reductant ABC exporter subunit CydD [Spiribacter sp.]
MTPQQWLARQRREVAGRLRLAAWLGVIEGLAIIAQAGLIAWVVHQTIIAERAISTLSLPVALLFGVVLLRPLLQSSRASAGIAAASAVQSRVRERLLRHTEALGPTGAQAVGKGVISSQLTDQVDALEGYFSRYLPQMTIAVVVPLSIAAAAYTQDWIAASFLLIAAPLIPLFMALVGMGAERLNRDQMIALGRLSGQFLDRVRGITTLRLFGRTAEATDGITAGSDEYRVRSMRVLRVAFLSSAVLEFFASVAIAVVAIYVGFGLLGYIEYGPAPALSLFSGLFILLLAPEFFQPLRTLAQHYHDRASAVGAAELLAEFEARPVARTTAIPSAAPAATAPTVDAAITVTEVHLERPGRGEVLHIPALQAHRGDIVWLQGPSGSGKTTFLLALAGLLHPTSGQITRNLADQRIGWLGAPAFLASASLRENIRLGNPQASTEQIQAASERAGVTAFSQHLPDGLNTMVGERGVGLSGGQAQRVALARAFVSPAPCIMLDEPTAALDVDTERDILASLGALANEGRLVIVASHDQALASVATHHYIIQMGRLMPASSVA